MFTLGWKAWGLLAVVILVDGLLVHSEALRLSDKLPEGYHKRGDKTREHRVRDIDPLTEGFVKDRSTANEALNEKQTSHDYSKSERDGNVLNERKDDARKFPKDDLEKSGSGSDIHKSDNLRGTSHLEGSGSVNHGTQTHRHKGKAGHKKDSQLSQTSSGGEPDIRKRQFIYPSYGLGNTQEVLSPIVLRPRAFVSRRTLHADSCAVPGRPQCLNGGKCVPAKRGYYCLCLPEFIGLHCESKQSCLPGVCKNGGKCTDLQNSNFVCTCPEGFRGKNCEERSHCFSRPCYNGGTCTELRDGFACICDLGFRGSTCKDKDPCLPNPCKNGAVCFEQHGSYACSCTEGYRGQLCEALSSCLSHPCLNGGTCRDDESGFNCLCPSGHIGEFCEATLCSPNPCQNHGYCEQDGDSYHCRCQPGFRGENCEESLPCFHQPCLNGGVCMETGKRGGYGAGSVEFQCMCPRGYAGAICEDSRDNTEVNNDDDDNNDEVGDDDENDVSSFNDYDDMANDAAVVNNLRGMTYFGDANRNLDQAQKQKDQITNYSNEIEDRQKQDQMDRYRANGGAPIDLTSVSSNQRPMEHHSSRRRNFQRNDRVHKNRYRINNKLKVLHRVPTNTPQ